MRVTELKAKFDELSIDANGYSIGGPDYGEQYRIELTDRWHVFYSERGHKNNEHVFDSEEEACDYFYNIVIDECRRLK